jgi:hypothetical protein
MQFVPQDAAGGVRDLHMTPTEIGENAAGAKVKQLALSHTRVESAGASSILKWSSDRSGRKALSRFRELSGCTTQIADLHCFEIHRTSSQTSAVPRSLLKTTLAHDYICLSIRLDFVGQIWGNSSAKPCPSMPMRPPRGNGRNRYKMLF